MLWCFLEWSILVLFVTRDTFFDVIVTPAVAIAVSSKALSLP